MDILEGIGEEYVFDELVDLQSILREPAGRWNPIESERKQVCSFPPVARSCQTINQGQEVRPRAARALPLEPWMKMTARLTCASAAFDSSVKHLPLRVRQITVLNPLGHRFVALRANLANGLLGHAQNRQRALQTSSILSIFGG